MKGYIMKIIGGALLVTFSTVMYKKGEHDAQVKMIDKLVDISKAMNKDLPKDEEA